MKLLISDFPHDLIKIVYNSKKFDIFEIGNVLSSLPIIKSKIDIMDRKKIKEIISTSSPDYILHKLSGTLEKKIISMINIIELGKLTSPNIKFIFINEFSESKTLKELCNAYIVMMKTDCYFIDVINEDNITKSHTFYYKTINHYYCYDIINEIFNKGQLNKSEILENYGNYVDN